MDEVGEEGAGGHGAVSSKVEDGVVVVAAGDLEVDSEEEGFDGGAAGMGAVEGNGDTIVGWAEDVVEAGWGMAMWQSRPRIWRLRARRKDLRVAPRAWARQRMAETRFSGKARMSSRRVKDGIVAVAAGDLEVASEEEGLEGGAAGMGAAKSGGNIVVRPAKDVVEAGRGTTLW